MVKFLTDMLVLYTRFLLCGSVAPESGLQVPEII
jgi:hypothetical protein